MKILVDFDPFELDCIDPYLLKQNDDTLKEWLLKHHRERVLECLQITRKPPFHISNNNHEEVQDRIDSDLAAILNNNHQPKGAPTKENGVVDAVTQPDRRLELLDTIAQVQRSFLDTESLSDAFGRLLTGLLSMLNSQYGFIGEVKHTEDGDMYLQIHSRSSSELPVDDAARQFFERNAKEAVNLYNMHSLFGVCIKEKLPILSNDVHADHRAGGVPPGHPPLNKFLGAPFFKKHGEILGVVGIANKACDSYTQEDVELLETFGLTCSSVIEAYRQIKKNASLIADLEQKVKLRTENLQLANQNLEEANKRVLQASAAQLEMFACMSHEIRTPLNCIIGLSSVLQESNLSPMQDEAVRMIVSSGDLLLTVVNDVLDYSKLETGNVEIEIQRSSLQETLNALVHSIATKARGKQISLRTHYDVSLPEFLNTDSRRVQQILFNLLGNAVKFGNTGSAVDLSLEVSKGDPPPNAYSPSPALLVKHKHFVRFTVKDYGRGIGKNDYERIFEPFRQATYETEQVYGGTGLGLAITAKIVHALGGRIYVDSIEGQWSRFTVDLPCDGPVTDPVKLTENLKNATVLLICGDMTVATQVGRIFDECRIKWVHCTSSEDLENRCCCEGFLERGRTYVCLMEESLFNDTAFELLSQLVSKSVLLTYGPDFSIPQSHCHYRSIVQVIPAVLIQSMGTHAVACGGQRGLVRQLSFRSASARYQEYTVLVAEDNKINQKVLVRMLKRIGIEKIDVVENGKEAVEAEGSKQYDVVFMDLQMPIMDGLEACEIITDRVTGHRIASVVFVTAHVSPAFEAKCEKAGASGFLPKPFNISDIEQCLQNMFLLRDGEYTGYAASIHLEDDSSDTSSLGMEVSG